jgi:hypothetical protein
VTLVTSFCTTFVILLVITSFNSMIKVVVTINVTYFSNHLLEILLYTFCRTFVNIDDIWVNVF